MDYQSYLAQITPALIDAKAIAVGPYDATVAYEEIFKWIWAATKLKIFSFITYSETISKAQMEEYSSICTDYARANKKGLPIGFQNGIVSNNIIVAESVDDDAIAFVTARPKKHYCVFEMPIIYDLSKGVLYSYTGEIIWGRAYQSFMKKYIADKFNI